MNAEIETKNSRAFYDLDSRQDKLVAVSSFISATDNSLLDKFARSWLRITTAWRIEPCREVINLDGSAFAPDAVLQREEDGRTIYLEFFGFWTPRYLKERLSEFERSGFTNYVLLLSEELRGSRDAPTNLPPNVVIYKTSPDARAVFAAVAQIETEPGA